MEEKGNFATDNSHGLSIQKYRREGRIRERRFLTLGRAVGNALEVPSPIADVLSFPLARRVHLIAKTAARVVRAKSQEQGENLLAATVRRQRAAMTRKGISPHRVELECRALENAIRARLSGRVPSLPTGNDAA